MKQGWRQKLKLVQLMKVLLISYRRMCCLHIGSIDVRRDEAGASFGLHCVGENYRRLSGARFRQNPLGFSLPLRTA